ncbi:hypothetical protein ACH35V_22070 [Actinomadura sp. 1N219]|uniref:hypothetical protein n=1 Tax=Actinomadura sp. 1N219 TaxID=3375152 RepID=UPI0037BB39F6
MSDERVDRCGERSDLWAIVTVLGARDALPPADLERARRTDEHQCGNEDPAPPEGVAGVPGGLASEDRHEPGDPQGVAGLARHVDDGAADGGHVPIKSNARLKTRSV